MSEIRDPGLLGASQNDALRHPLGHGRMSKEEEFALIEDWRENGNRQAFNKVYLTNMNLVHSLARLYRQVRVNREDLIQEGMVGLAEAIKAIDTKEGVPLGSYASKWIRASFRHYILKHHHIVPFAGTQAQRKLFFKLPQHIPVGRKLTDSERCVVAEKLKTTPDQIRLVEERLKITQASMHHSDPGENFMTDGSEVMPVIDESEGPEELVIKYLDHEKQKIRFAETLEEMEPRQRELIQRRYLIEEGEKRPPHSEFCKEFGISREGVRQIEEKAFKRMKSLFKKEVGK